MDRKKNISHYFGENSRRFFKIPAYQRGYKWGVRNEEGESAATILLKDIIEAYDNGKSEYFIQGITVYENNPDVVLIDGQQRTTTLFILLSLILNEDEKEKYLFHQNTFKMKYDIRESSQEFLKLLCTSDSVDLPDHPSQDIFYLNEVRNQLKEILNSVDDTNGLKEYLLTQVVLFFIVVPEEQATRVFSMMNGSKAFMKTDELIKADFLGKASKVNKTFNVTPSTIRETFEVLKDQIGEDWEANALRSQFARQWDKWLYWWNREEVKAFFRSDNNPMGLLLEYFYLDDYVRKKDSKFKNLKDLYSNKPEDVSVIFKKFQNQFIKNREEANFNFEKLRKLQKKFEDLYNIPLVYNYLGLALEANSNRTRRYQTISYFLENYKELLKIRTFTLLSLFNIPIDTDQEKIKDIIKTKFKVLADTNVYNNEDSDIKETAFRLLLKLNVEAAIDRKVKFDFLVSEKGKLKSFYSKRSLEHIWPKSRIFTRSEDGKHISVNGKVIEESQIENYIEHGEFKSLGISEHHIGNLVLLHKNDNSNFSDKVPEDKKKLYFDLDVPLISRNLLHTMSVFAYDNWGSKNAVNTISANQKNVIRTMKKGFEEYAN